MITTRSRQQLQNAAQASLHFLDALRMLTEQKAHPLRALSLCWNVGIPGSRVVLPTFGLTRL
jgi:hypothetical protein